MKIRQILVVLLLPLSLVWSQLVGAQEAGGRSESGPVELFACEFVDGKGMEDLSKANERFNKWADKNDMTYSAWVLFPQFRSSGIEMDFLWVGSWENGAGMGSGLDAWMKEVKEDTELAQGYADVMDCSAGHVLMSSVEINAPDGPPVDGIVWFSQCSLADGKTGMDALAAHGKAADALGGMGISSSSWAFFPALGLPDAQYDYLQVVAHKSYAHLGDNYDKYYMQGGLQKARAILEGVSQCKSPNLFDAVTVRSPES
jgi:hypothetical protein